MHFLKKSQRTKSYYFCLDSFSKNFQKFRLKTSIIRWVSDLDESLFALEIFYKIVSHKLE